MPSHYLPGPATFRNSRNLTNWIAGGATNEYHQPLLAEPLVLVTTLRMTLGERPEGTRGVRMVVDGKTLGEPGHTIAELDQGHLHQAANPASPRVHTASNPTAHHGQLRTRNHKPSQ